ncbi:hypothetical protein HHI36_022400 [Cryptolaemus montrouzieri]|uniref:Uncharacterized protein n=1 Tax=Cryptolaemus montrouzieri TaxID=559131 RepID=A0ABD2MZY1_9CUCU
MLHWHVVSDLANDVDAAFNTTNTEELRVLLRKFPSINSTRLVEESSNVIKSADDARAIENKETAGTEGGINGNETITNAVNNDEDESTPKCKLDDIFNSTNGHDAKEVVPKNSGVIAEERVDEWMANKEMLVANNGQHTFRRFETGTDIDLTLYTPELNEGIRGWEVFLISR